MNLIGGFQDSVMLRDVMNTVKKIRILKMVSNSSSSCVTACKEGTLLLRVRYCEGKATLKKEHRYSINIVS